MLSWNPRDWNPLSSLHRKLDLIHSGVVKMGTAVQEFVAAFQRYQQDVATWQQQTAEKAAAAQAGVQKLIDAAVAAKGNESDAALKQATDALNAAHVDLASHITEAAPAAPTPPDVQGAPAAADQAQGSQG